MTADLHYIVVLAQRVAEGRRRHPSNAAFGEWVKNDPAVLRHNRGPLTHQDRAALLKIAQLDPQEASAAIRRHGTFAGPERLWRDWLRHLAAPKTTPAAPEPPRKTAEAVVRKTAPELEPEPELDDEAYADKVEEFLERLRLAGGDTFEEPADWYVWFEEEVLQLVWRLNLTTHDAFSVFETWLEVQALFVLNDDDRDFMIELMFESRCNIWYDVVERSKTLRQPRRRGRR